MRFQHDPENIRQRKTQTVTTQQVAVCVLYNWDYNVNSEKSMT